MNMLWSWIDPNTLGLTAVEVLLKLTVVLGAVAVVSLLTNFTAATKRLLWSAAIVIALLFPLISEILPPIEISLPQASPSAPPLAMELRSNGSRPDTQLTLSTLPTITVAENTAGTIVEPAASWFTWQTLLSLAVLVWLLGVVFFIGKVWRQHHHGKAIKSNAERFDTGNNFPTAFQSGNSVAVPVFVSEDIATPIALGVFKPIIVLPVAARTWDCDKLRSAVAHELAHVKGRDNLIRCCASVLCALYWFHPLAWYGARKLREEQEKTADNAVLNQGVTASVYAQNLLDIVKALQGNTYENQFSASMASYSFFPQRMRSILSESQNRQGLSIGKAIVMISIICILAIPVTLMTTQATRAQENNEEEPVRYIDFAQNTLTEENPRPDPQPQSEPTANPNPNLNPKSPEVALFQDLDTQMTDAFNQRSLDKLVGMYTDTARIIVEQDFRNETYQGKREIEKYWGDLLASDMTIRSQVQNVERSGDEAKVTVRYWASFATDFGTLNDFFGGTTTTDWQLIDGQWRIVDDRVHEPDYVSQESIDRIVDTALASVGSVDWEDFGKDMAESMERLSKELANNFHFDDQDWDWNWDSQNRHNPLLNAVESGNSKSVELLLENGADANASGSWGRTALYFASESGNEDMVKQLLKHGAAVNTTSSYGKTPLYVAAENGHLDVVKILVKNDADVNKQTRSGRSPLSAAAAGGHDEVVKYLLEQGADVRV